MTSTDRSPAWSGRVVRWLPITWLGVLIVLTCPIAHAQQTTQSADQLRWRPPRDPALRVTAQHSRTLAEPTARRAADRPASQQSPVTVLRWRTSGVVRAKISSDGPGAPVEVVTVSGSTHEAGAVRPASATTSAIPYRVANAEKEPWEEESGPPLAPPQELPFTDRDQPLAMAVLLQEQEPPSEPPSEPEAAPARPRTAEPELAPVPDNQLGGAAPLEPEEDPAPRPQVQLLPEPPGAAREESCDRIYNERDCCKDEENCGEARQHWQRDAISKISLDITPKLVVDDDDALDGRAERNLDLSKTPVRTYRDRQNRELATGRLTGMQYGRLLILDDNNQVVKVPWDDLSDDDLCFVTAWWRIPTECTFGDEVYEGRNWIPSTLTWKATGVCHKPLYFEEPQLERYGHTTGHFAQPVLSGAHFFLNLVALPYHAGISPPWECQYPLGYYRPGSCAPWLVPPVPLSVRGALWEAGAWVGGIAIIP